MVVTGCTGGLGIETARAFCATGATVWITGRNIEKLEAVASELRKSSGDSSRVTALEMDQTSLASVRSAARTVLATSNKLNILVNNAAVMATPYELTVDGHESQWATDHLAHFLFTGLLLPKLLSSSTPDFPSRVVNVSSSSHRNGPPDFSDLDFTGGREYSPGKGYGQSKTANIWHANRLNRIYSGKGLHGISLNPGGIWTGLQKHVPSEQIEKWKADANLMKGTMTSAQGAATQVIAALGSEFRSTGGIYLENCRESVSAEEAGGDGGTLYGYKPWAFDPEGEATLWKVSSEIVRVQI
ncbi:MAG: hypothetical protein Q9157_006690 [Trypethelium eluteriae]